MDLWCSKMEALVISASFWSGRRVLLTGHTGFKGAWTALLLRRLGSDVYGLALPPSSNNGIFVAGDVERDVHNGIGDIRDIGVVSRVLADSRPHVVIHMAAQSLVRESYADPVGTYATNVMGTVNVLECVRHSPGIEAVVIVTSDKCYDNIGEARGYRETEPLGGHDPYSSSKGCAELVTSAYRHSFFLNDAAPPVASARAGNVIGGGDWAEDRLVPDAMRAFFAGSALNVRNPHAVRPWQYVLEPILAYLALAERLAEGGRDFAEAWNFGPAAESEVSVAEICDHLCQAWGQGARWSRDGGDHPHEAAVLKLDCSKARARLGWQPLFDLERGLELTVDWYKALQRGADMRAFTLAQVNAVLSDSGVADDAAA
jgi:CDP-glucose 4,6-dehydratase